MHRPMLPVFRHAHAFILPRGMLDLRTNRVYRGNVLCGLHCDVQNTTRVGAYFVTTNFTTMYKTKPVDKHYNMLYTRGKHDEVQV